MEVNVYEGRFGNEQLLFSDDGVLTVIVHKGDFIFYKDEAYRVMYVMADVDNEEYAIFVRKAVEEDY